jgi:hypothetical protein
MNKVDVGGVELGTKYEGNNCDKSKSVVLINGHYANMTYTLRTISTVAKSVLLFNVSSGPRF